MPGTSGTWLAAELPGDELAMRAARLSGCRMHLLRGDGMGPGAAGSRLGRVDDEALADQRVQGPVSELRGGGLAHDVPDQQPVVGAGKRVLVVVHADCALQPPVGRVQCVRVVMLADVQSGPS